MFLLSLKFTKFRLDLATHTLDRTEFPCHFFVILNFFLFKFSVLREIHDTLQYWKRKKAKIIVCQNLYRLALFLFSLAWWCRWPISFFLSLFSPVCCWCPSVFNSHLCKCDKKIPLLNFDTSINVGSWNRKIQHFL